MAMRHCHNCGEEIQGGMKFCPHCGQDQTVVVPQDQRIPPEDVPTPEDASQGASTPPPSLYNTRQGEGGVPPQGGSEPLSGIPKLGGIPKKWQIAGVLGCGGVGLLLLALVVVGIVSSASNNTAQSGGGQEDGEDEKKSTSKSNSGSDSLTVAVGEPAELDDHTLTVTEVERNYTPNNRFSKAESGNEYLRVFITITNTSKQTIDYNPFNFEVQDSNGVQKNQSFVPEVPYNLESGNLAPKGKVEGNMIFEVPRNDNNLKLIYKSNMFSGETVTVEPLQ